MKHHSPRAAATVFLTLVLSACSSSSDDNPPADIQFVSSGPCDNGIVVDTSNALEAARAIGICDGLVSAQWELPDGVTTLPMGFELGHGMLNGFGTNVSVIEGNVMLALSSGTARQPTDTGYQPPNTGGEKGYTHGYPVSANITYPYSEPNCSDTGTPNDGIALRVTLNVPDGVNGYSFRTNYYTTGYPDFVCPTGTSPSANGVFADQAAVLLTDSTYSNFNIIFDAEGNPVNDYALLDVCLGCTLGASELVATGFDNHGATGWLLHTAPATAGDTVELVFMIWDSGDGAYDATILLDDFQWTTQ